MAVSFGGLGGTKPTGRGEGGQGEMGGEERVVMMKEGGLDGFFKKQQNLGLSHWSGSRDPISALCTILASGVYPRFTRVLCDGSRPATKGARLSGSPAIPRVPTKLVRFSPKDQIWSGGSNKP